MKKLEACNNHVKSKVICGKIPKIAGVILFLYSGGNLRSFSRRNIASDLNRSL
jgi:hypothetical protein